MKTYSLIRDSANVLIHSSIFVVRMQWDKSWISNGITPDSPTGFVRCIYRVTESIIAFYLLISTFSQIRSTDAKHYKSKKKVTSWTKNKKLYVSLSMLVNNIFLCWYTFVNGFDLFFAICFVYLALFKLKYQPRLSESNSIPLYKNFFFLKNM